MTLFSPPLEEERNACVEARVADFGHPGDMVPGTVSPQANLFALEACTEGALARFDRQVGKEAVEWLTYFQPLPQTYLVQFIDEVDAMYVRGSSRGKTRFSRLPDHLRMLSPTSPEYKAFEAQMVRTAKEKNCDPADLERAEDFPLFKW
jgi:hypothetical protein